MMIDPARLRADGERLIGDEAAPILELEGECDVRVESPVHYDLWAQPISGRKLLVRGTLGVDIRLICSRCAEPFRYTASDTAFEYYRELKGNESVDLTPHIREAILLRFPSHPLCRPLCKGLCIRCGANLNDGPCGCCAPPEAPGWRALTGLTIQEGAEDGCSQEKGIEVSNSDA
jgi:uncharacterized protein